MSARSCMHRQHSSTQQCSRCLCTLEACSTPCRQPEAIPQAIGYRHCSRDVAAAAQGRRMHTGLPPSKVKPPRHKRHGRVPQRELQNPVEPHVSREHRRSRPAIGLRRSDISAIRSKAHISDSTSLGELDMERLIPSLDAAASEANDVEVDMRVEAVGAGFFVRADVRTRLALSCDCCLATFEHPVRTHFEAWLNATRDADAECTDPSELPFPPGIKVADLSDLTREAVGCAAPASALCGRPSCSTAQAKQGIGISGMASGWAAGPSTDSEDDPDAEPQSGLKSPALRQLADMLVSRQ